MNEFYQCPSCCPYRQQQPYQEMNQLNESMYRQAPPACPNGFLYTVVPGDTMFMISRRFNVNLDALVRANPQANPAQLVVGQRLCVPTAYTPPPVPTPQCPGGTLYTVRPGDTITAIANAHRVSVVDLLRANPQLSNPNMLVVGQLLCIPGAGTPTPPHPGPGRCPDGFIYTVRRGDTLSAIAQRYDLTVQGILRVNPHITDPARLNIGDQLCIPLPIPEPPTCTGTVYIVRKGETISTIAAKFQVTTEAILRANPQIKDGSVIFTGQVICIPTTREE